MSRHLRAVASPIIDKDLNAFLGVYGEVVEPEGDEPGTVHTSLVESHGFLEDEDEEKIQPPSPCIVSE